MKANGTDDNDMARKLSGLTLSETPAGLNNLNDEIAEPGNTPEEFHSAVQESLSKLVQHNLEFVKDLLSKGFMSVLFPVTGGLALVIKPITDLDQVQPMTFLFS